MPSSDTEFTVTCRQHGPMRHDFARDAYTCKGYDGEGCGRQAGNQEIYLIRLISELRSRGLDDIARGALYFTGMPEHGDPAKTVFP